MEPDHSLRGAPLAPEPSAPSTSIIKTPRSAYWSIYGTRIAVLAIGFLTSVISARGLGPAGRGTLAVFVTAIASVVQVANFGLSSSVLYFVSRRHRRGGSLLVISWGAGFALFALCMLTYVVLRRVWPLPVATLLAALWAPIQLVALLQDQVFLGLRRFRDYNRIQIVGRAVALLSALIAVVIRPGDVTWFMASQLLIDGLTAVAGAGVLLHIGEPLRFPTLRIGPILRLGVRAAPVLIVPFLLIRSDILLMRVFRGANETGVYAVAAQLIDILLLLPASFGQVLFVSLAGSRDLAQETRHVARVVLRLLLLLAAVGAIAGAWAIPWVFGAGFDRSFYPFLILLPGAVLLGFQTIVVQYFGARAYPRFLTVYWVAGFLLNVAVNCAAIPRFGSLGAAATSTLSYGLVAILVVRKFGHVSGMSIRLMIFSARSGEAIGGHSTGITGRVLVLTVFPLPGEIRLPNALSVESVSLSALRSEGVRSALQRLRSSTTGTVLFAWSRGESQEMRGLADLALSVSAAPCKGYLDLHSGAVTPAPRLLFLRSGIAFGWAFLCGSLALARNSLAVAHLLKSRPNRHKMRPIPQVTYLRASFGLPSFGGSVGHTAGVVQAFESNGYRVAVFASSRPEGLSESVAFRQVSLPSSVAYPNELNTHRFSRRFTRAVRKSGEVRQSGFVYQRYAPNDLSGVRLARSLGICCVLEYNGSEVWAQRNWGRSFAFESVSRKIELANLRHADLVATVSEPLMEEAVAAGAPEKRVVFYPNGVDPRVFDPQRYSESARRETRRELGLPEDACVLTFVGTFGRWHGAEVLAEAIQILESTNDSAGLHFLFVGDGATAPQVRNLLAEPIRRRSVTMTGGIPSDRIPAVLATSDMLLSPHVRNRDGTTFFGSPTKLFEYMSMAKPIIASDLDQLGKLLRGWVPGVEQSDGPPLAILVEPGDPRSLADGLRKAVRLGPAARRELGNRARAQILAAFTWDHHVGFILRRLKWLSGLPTP